MHGEQPRGDKEQSDSRCKPQNKEARFCCPSAFFPVSFSDLPVFRVSAGLGMSKLLRLRDAARSLSKLLGLRDTSRSLSKLLRLSLRCLAGLLRLLRLPKLLRLLCLWILTC